MSSPSSPSFALLSSTRYDPFLKSLKWNAEQDGTPSPYMLLSYHLARLADAATEHAWPDALAALSYTALKSECDRAVRDYTGSDPPALKIRVVLTHDGALSATAAPVRPFTSDPCSPSFFNPDTDNPSLFKPVLTVHLDTQPIPSSLFTSTKTTNRAPYDDARARAGVPTLSSSASPSSPPPPHTPYDVLLYNTHSHITESSISNVAFFRSSVWVTPPASTGCLPGVLRRWLLEQGRIREAGEGLLTRSSIREGEWVLLFNGVQGCQLARVVRRDGE